MLYNKISVLGNPSLHVYRLLTDKEYWSAVSNNVKPYSDSFGEGYSEKILDSYFGSDRTKM